MKKIVLFILGIMLTGIFNMHAQDLAECDLEFAYFNPADTVIVLEPEASYTFRMTIINHGPDVFDSLDFVYFSATNVPEGFILVAEDTLLQMPYMEVGNGIVTDAMGFSNEHYQEEDNAFEMCFWRIDNFNETFYTDTNAVNDTICIKVIYKAWPDSATAIQPVAAAEQITLYPNPFRDDVYITSSSEMDKLSYRLVDIQGRQVAAGIFETAGNNKALLNLRPYPNGIYFIEIQSGKAMSRHKLVKY